MQSNSAASFQTPQTSYQAAVPISLYREVSAELHAVQAKLAVFELENELLAKQNKTLTQELEAVVASHKQLQETLARSSDKLQTALQQSHQFDAKFFQEPIAYSQSGSQTGSQSFGQTFKPPSPDQSRVPPLNQHVNQHVNQQARSAQFQEVAPRAKTVTSPQPQQIQVPDFFYYQAPERAPEVETYTEPTIPPESDTERDIPVSGWWLTLTIVLIVVTSFGAGYLLMKPLVRK